MNSQKRREIYYAGKNDENSGILIAPFKVGSGTVEFSTEDTQAGLLSREDFGDRTTSPEGNITISAPLLEVGELRTVVVQGNTPQMLHLQEKLRLLTEVKHSELKGDKFGFIGSWVSAEPFTWLKRYVYRQSVGGDVIVDVTKLFDEKPYEDSQVTGIRMRFALWDISGYSEMLISRALTFVLRRDLALELDVQLRRTYMAVEVYQGKTVARKRMALPEELEDGNVNRTPLPLLHP